MKQNKNNKWILMADIVDSRHKNSEKILIQFKEIVLQLNHKKSSSLLSPLTITLGDEFQGITKNLKQSIEVILFLEETIIKENYDFELRYVIKNGAIDTEINKEIAYGMLGEGLTRARELLEDLKKSTHKLTIESQNPKKDCALSDAFLIYGSIVRKWTKPEDRKLASEFIKYQDYKIVAEKISKSRSQIWKREKSLDIANYLAIKRIITYLY